MSTRFQQGNIYMKDNDILSESEKEQIEWEVKLEMAQIETPIILREIADELSNISSVLQDIVNMLERP